MYLFTCSIKCYTDIFTTFKCYKWLCKYALCTRQWLFYHHFYFLCSSSLHSCRSMRSLGKLTSQQWSRLVLLDPDWFFLRFRASGGTWSRPVLQAGQTDLLDLRVERWTSGRLEGCLSAFLLLSTSRTSTCNRQFQSSDACQASSLPALLCIPTRSHRCSAAGCKRRVQHKMAVLIRDIWVHRGGAGSDPAGPQHQPRLI